MVPPGRARTEEHQITWGAIGKTVLGFLIAWAAWEFRQMREAVYTSGTKIAVVEAKVNTLEGVSEKYEKRIENLESRLMEGTK